MSWGDTGVVFGWSNPVFRYDNKWTITPYLANSAVTADVYVTYKWDDMQTKFGEMQAKAKATHCYDQIVVTTNKETVPSAGDSGPAGDVVS